MAVVVEADIVDDESFAVVDAKAKAPVLPGDSLTVDGNGAAFGLRDTNGRRAFVRVFYGVFLEVVEIDLAAEPTGFIDDLQHFACSEIDIGKKPFEIDLVPLYPVDGDMLAMADRCESQITC